MRFPHPTFLLPCLATSTPQDCMRHGHSVTRDDGSGGTIACISTATAAIHGTAKNHIPHKYATTKSTHLQNSFQNNNTQRADAASRSTDNAQLLRVVLVLVVVEQLDQRLHVRFVGSVHLLGRGLRDVRHWNGRPHCSTHTHINDRTHTPATQQSCDYQVHRGRAVTTVNVQRTTNHTANFFCQGYLAGHTLKCAVCTQLTDTYQRK